MTIYEYGNPDADTVLIQLTGDHELSVLKNEVEEIRKRTSTDFRLIAAKVDDWNYELSPWKAPAVFGNEDFGDGAVRTLEQILTLCTDKSRTYYIGGYSLAGLFSLWAAYQTDVFSGIAAASPSVWFPGFIACCQECAVFFGSAIRNILNLQTVTVASKHAVVTRKPSLLPYDPDRYLAHTLRFKVIYTRRFS